MTRTTAPTLESPLLTRLGGYIHGRWAEADSGKTTPVINPATGRTLADVPKMGAEETRRAIAAAEACLESPTPIEQRRTWLTRIADDLRAHREELGRIITLEHGKPWKEAQGEVDYAAGFFQYCADHVGELAPRRLDERPKGHAWTVHFRPVGVVGLISPWNFPIAMMAKKLSAALAADCACLVKPSIKTPLTMIAQFALLDAMDLPPGKVNLLIGSAREIGGVFCSHPSVSMISFTGSTEVGRKLIRDTADQVKKLALELGGNAPFIVFDDADLDAATDHLIQNKFRGGGQTCVCANRIYAHRSIADAFAAKVAERVERMTVGDGMEPDTDLGPLIDRDGFDKVKRHLDDAVGHGARVIAGGDPPEPRGDDWGCFFPPTVVTGVTNRMACVREETFGPLVPILTFDSESDAVHAGNDTEYGLAAYVFTRNRDRAERVIRRLRFGHVGLNTGTGPTPVAPFGGMKQSGFGREGGPEGLHEFVQPQTVPEPAS